MGIVFVGGGSRSGKSAFALQRARRHGVACAFVATAEAWDDEMKGRIDRHRAERGPECETFEEPIDLARVIRDCSTGFHSIVVDCLTLWLSNLMHAAGEDIEGRTSELLEVASRAEIPVILVSNEVGCGIVPENPAARLFRDLAGRLNQRCVECSDEAFWVVFGVPLRIKPGLDV